MNKNFAKIAIPAAAVATFAMACSDPMQPGTTAGMMPDTLMARAPIDTFAVAPRMPDTVTVAQRMPDTVAVAQRMPIDTLY